MPWFPAASTTVELYEVDEDMYWDIIQPCSSTWPVWTLLFGQEYRKHVFVLTRRIFFCFCFLKVLIFVRICFDVGRKMVEEVFQPDPWQQQNEAHSAKTFEKSFLSFCLKNRSWQFEGEELAARRGRTGSSSVSIRQLVSLHVANGAKVCHLRLESVLLTSVKWAT